MQLIFTGLALLLIAGALALLASRYLSRRVEAEFPPVGAFAEIDGVRLHHIDIPAGPDPEFPPILFIHGAGGNARDLRFAVSRGIHGRGRMLFVDRPGAGYSERGGGASAAPDRQAALIAGLMKELGMEKAIVVGHSFGAAVALAMAVGMPERVAGLVLVAPASHPWPGGGVTWYYRLSRIPVLGRIFIETLVIPVGNLLYRRAVREIFSPDPVPKDYHADSGARLLLRPRAFRYNAQDVNRLYDHVSRLSQHYHRIEAPTVIVSGESDNVVVPQYHAHRLASEIRDAKLIKLDDAGHMPAHVVPEEIVRQIEWLSVRLRDTERQADMPA